MLVAGNEQCRPLTLVRVGDAPVRRERPGDLLCEGALELLAPILQPLDPELHAHEEGAALGIGRVLVGAEDVRVALEEKPGDGRDDPVTVGT